MFREIPRSIKLWKHQRAALRFLANYLQNYDGPCVIRMPTGTGKTGVIACASLLSPSGRTLVLTPWSNLRDQMIGDLKQGFWSKIGAPPPPGAVVGMLPTTTEAVLKRKDVKVIVCTFSTLTKLRQTMNAAYVELASQIDLVIVDECHYEPAIEWGKSVKRLAKPTVLLTATPYRNDLKLFRVRNAETAVFQYTHIAAEKAGVVRELDIRPLDNDTNIDALSKSFIAMWRKAVSQHRLISAAPRAIVCCANAADIKRVVATFRKAKLDAIGIHETFGNSSSANGLMKNVPRRDISASIWVHQNKLTEGLDDPRFCCLAVFCPINNDRKLVQQIGRILRKQVSDRRGKLAVMFAPSAFKLSERWRAYRQFEKDASLCSPEHYRHFVERMLEAQPDVEYFDGRFRRRFRTDVLSSNPQVVIAPSVLVRKVDHDFSVGEYIEDCTDSLNLADAIILGKPNEPCQRSEHHALWIYASVVNSRILLDSSFYEIQLQAHCVVLAGRYLFASDTSGTYPEDLIERRTITLGAADLSRLLGARYRLTNVSISSAVPFDTVLRASEYRAHNLASIPASLTDRIQICRAARGASTGSRRYLGLHRGRIREELPEQLRRTHSVADFRAWAESLAAELAAVGGTHPVLQRYMQPVTPPSTPVPVSISIDLSTPDVLVTKVDNSPLCASTLSAPVKIASSKGYAFDLTFDGAVNSRPTDRMHLQVRMEYDPHKVRFWFRSNGASDVQVQWMDNSHIVRKSLPEYLNHNQDLILIGLEGGVLVYQGRNFYGVDYTHAERELLAHIVPGGEYPCHTEKGTSAELIEVKKRSGKITKFLSGSLFKAIAEKKVTLPFDPELVICDDLGSECADFILANFTNKQIALVHAKAWNGARISASAFHDIVAQAMKNLVYLSRNAEQPKGVGSWKKRSMWNRTDIPRLFKVPSRCPTGPELWSKLRSEIIDSAGGQLHLILATTGCCDLAALQRAISNPHERTAETAQLFHLLDGLIGYARQLGVQVTVIDVRYAAPVEAAKHGSRSRRTTATT